MTSLKKKFFLWLGLKKMKVSDLEGTIHKWKIEQGFIRSNDQRPRSKLHLTARSLLKEIYPTLQICEEVPVQLRGQQKVFIDFYINTIKTVIEVHGEQHYKFNSLFHTSAQDFINQKTRDNNLKEWCELNNLNYIELPFNESQDKWKIRILQEND